MAARCTLVDSSWPPIKEGASGYVGHQEDTGGKRRRATVAKRT